jgi:hypothetical protein
MCRKPHKMSETSTADGAPGDSGSLSTSLSNVVRLAASVGFQRQLRWDNHL